MYEVNNLCTNCKLCLEVCPTYRATGEILYSPIQRLITASQIENGIQPSEQMVESILNCPKCMQCELVCPEGIKITQVIHETRKKLVECNVLPLPKQKTIIQGILAKGNAVNGDPVSRLDWLPEKMPTNESDTLLFLGCLPSYMVKEAATSTYLVLKKLGIDFMILNDEGCCGTYIYESGQTDVAGEFFIKNVERFKSLGLKKLLVPCMGCYKCFKFAYPELLGRVDFVVQHVLNPIVDVLSKNPTLLKIIDQRLTFQDSCRMSRGDGITEEPRQLLKLCGVEIVEPEHKEIDAVCCGAGGGIRSLYRDLSTNIASTLLNSLPADDIVSVCPFCVFNLSYTASKANMNKNIIYFTTALLRSLS